MSCQGDGVAHRQPTIIDVARRAGVSKSLVSMALRGDPGVSQTRQEAVLDAAAQLGYRPNRAASILAGTRTDTVGVIVEDLPPPRRPSSNPPSSPAEPPDRPPQGRTHPERPHPILELDDEE
jgi:transcriptional regulator with XRE-family HTH domain